MRARYRADGRRAARSLAATAVGGLPATSRMRCVNQEAKLTKLCLVPTSCSSLDDHAPSLSSLLPSHYFPRAEAVLLFTPCSFSLERRHRESLSVSSLDEEPRTSRAQRDAPRNAALSLSSTSSLLSPFSPSPHSALRPILVRPACSPSTPSPSPSLFLPSSSSIHNEGNDASVDPPPNPRLPHCLRLPPSSELMHKTLTALEPGRIPSPLCNCNHRHVMCTSRTSSHRRPRVESRPQTHR